MIILIKDKLTKGVRFSRCLKCTFIVCLLSQLPFFCSKNCLHHNKIKFPCQSSKNCLHTTPLAVERTSMQKKGLTTDAFCCTLEQLFAFLKYFFLHKVLAKKRTNHNMAAYFDHKYGTISHIWFEITGK